MNGPAALHIEQLDVRYGAHVALAGFSAPALEPGRITALLGPNGSGKSTLLKALVGLLPVQDGRIRLGKQDLTRASFAERARHLAYLPQSLPAAVHLRALESVLAAANAANGPTHTPTDAQRLLERLGIGHLALCYLDELSGGQKQLLGLAQALVRRPRILLLDEPLSALDLNYQFHVMELLRQETRQNGLITLLVLHDLNIALRHADCALMMRAGQAVACAAPTAAITPQNLSRVYGVKARVETCSQGIPHVLVDALEHALH